MQVSIIYNLLKNQGEHLSAQTEKCINTLNQIKKDLPDLIKEHQPKCIILFNHGQDSYDIHLCLLSQSGDFIHFHDKYEMDFNNDNTFGLEDLEYDEIEHYPTEDYFTVQRSTYLEKLFFEWLLECTWNSKLIKTDLPLIYSATADCDELYDMKNAMMEYHDFTFLDS